MNYTIIDFPENVSFRGVLIDAKPAKLSETTKRPALASNYLKGLAVKVVTSVKDFGAKVKKAEITVVNHASQAAVVGVKKLRVGRVVTTSISEINNNVEKIDVIPRVEEVPKPIVEPPVEVKVEPIPSMEPTIVNTRSDIHGRHEHTGPIPVTEVNERIHSDVSLSGTLSRASRNAMVSQEEPKVETQPGNMELYNDLMNRGNDFSKKLQGAKNELELKKEESKQLDDALSKELQRKNQLEQEIVEINKEKEYRVQAEYENTQNEIGKVDQEILEKTSNITYIRAEISKLEAQKRAALESAENDFY